MTKNTKLPIDIQFEPEFVEGLRYLFEEKVPFNQLLGLKIATLLPERVVIRIEMKPHLIGHYTHQRLHGGVISAGLDATGALAVMAASGARHMSETPEQRLHRFTKLGTIDLRVDYLRPAIGSHFELHGKVLRLGSRVASTQMEFFGPEGQLLSVGSAAYIVS